MTLRRISQAGLAALLALGPALALTAPPAQAATKPGYVAVVISGHGAHCVKWKSGITGDTVLNDAADVDYRSDGLIVSIDGSPSSGTADSSHFWSYWHDKAGKTWSFSNYGASSYHPAAGSVEGWSYDNGRSDPPKPSPKPAGLYAKTCGSKDKKSPVGTVPVPAVSTSAHSGTTRATATASTTPGRPSTRHRSTSARTARSTAPSSAPSTPAESSATPSLSTSAGTTATASRTRAHAAASGPSSSAAVAPASSIAPSASPASSHRTAHPVNASASVSSSSSGSPVGLFVALGLVVVLAGGATAVALRRRNAGG